MGDAEIIPLGTRGRPGRGTSQDKPSQSSRALTRQGRPRPQDGAGPQPSPPAQAPPPERAADPDLAPAGTPSVVLPAQKVGGPSRAGGVDDPRPADSDRLAAEGAADSHEPLPEPPPAPDRPADGGAGEAPSGSSGARTSPGLSPPAADILDAAVRAAQAVLGDNGERRLAELLAFLRRRVTGDYQVDAFGLDPEVTDRFLLEMIRPLATKWFRVEVRGAENIPEDGGALIVANHSGTLPLDGLVTMFAVHEATGRHIRPLGADLVFRLPFIGEVARKAGATLACHEDAVRLLSTGELAGVWPEGFKGIGKPYRERYKLQRFGRGGFVSAALRTGVPIVPCSIVGAEEIYPLVGNIPALARLLGLPYVPITPFFPLLGPLGLVPLPSKWIIEFGEPIRTDSYDEGAADDPMLVFNVTDQVRETIQQTLYALLMRRKSVFH